MPNENNAPAAEGGQAPITLEQKRQLLAVFNLPSINGRNVAGMVVDQHGVAIGKLGETAAQTLIDELMAMLGDDERQEYESNLKNIDVRSGALVFKTDDFARASKAFSDPHPDPQPETDLAPDDDDELEHGPDEHVGPRRIFRSIKRTRKMTAAETKQINQAIQDDLDTLDTLEEEKKKTAKKYAADIEEQKGYLAEHRRKARSGTVDEFISCELQRDFDAGLRVWIDRETGEQIDTEPLTPEDRQRAIEDDIEENARREAAAEEAAEKGSDPPALAETDWTAAILETADTKGYSEKNARKVIRDEFDKDLEELTGEEANKALQIIQSQRPATKRKARKAKEKTADVQA